MEEISKKKEFKVFAGWYNLIWLDNLYALDKLHLIPFSYLRRKSHAAFALSLWRILYKLDQLEFFQNQIKFA